MTTKTPASARLREAGRSLERRSNALLLTKLIALLADRQLYGRALADFYFVHKQLELVLKECISRGHPGR
jgi:hypothetical protein